MHMQRSGQAPDHSSESRLPATSRGLLQAFAAPQGKVYLLYGDDTVFRLSHRVGAQVLGQGGSVALVDGANRFDVHAIVRFAREQRLDPDALLRRLFISRGFTCYQMEAAVTERLPSFLERTGSRTALIFGLLDTFYDEQAPLRDVESILLRVQRALLDMKERGVSILLASTEWNVLPAERNLLLEHLKLGMDRVYRLEMQGEQSLQLVVERSEEHNALDPSKRGEPRHGKNCPDVYEHH